MKRLLQLALLLAAVMAVSLAVDVANAAAISCTPTAQHGGEHAPQFVNSGFGINNPVQGGYNCTKAFTAHTYAQFESGGTWNGAVNGNGETLDISHGPYTCCTGHLWTEPTQTPVVGGGLLRPCRYNWRYHVVFYASDGSGTAADVSPELFSNC